MYDVIIRAVPRRTLAALRHGGRYDAIADSFSRLFAWADRNGLSGPETRCIAIFYDDPDRVPVEALRSDACLTVPDGVAIESPVRAMTLDPGLCAVIRHKGPYDRLPQAYRWIFGTWMPSSGYVVTGQASFEEYVNDPSALPPAEWLTDIHVPVRTR